MPRRQLPRPFDQGGGAQRQHFLYCTFADQEVLIVAVAHDNRHATANEIEWDFVDLSIVLQFVEQLVLQGEF